MGVSGVFARFEVAHVHRLMLHCCVVLRFFCLLVGFLWFLVAFLWVYDVLFFWFCGC